MENVLVSLYFRFHFSFFISVLESLRRGPPSSSTVLYTRSSIFHPLSSSPSGCQPRTTGLTSFIMTKAKSYIPEGFRTVTPHLTVNGAANYIDFLKRAFNAVEISKSPGPGGKLMHAHVRIGDSDLMF